MAGILSQYNYIAVVLLMMIGLYGMIAKNNLVKKIIGMNIFQTAIILFYISAGAKKGGTLPVLIHDPRGGSLAEHAIRVQDYINPLPHVLMLTAIVVSVATLGVALALSIKIYHQYHTLEENEINEKLRKE